MENMQKYNEVFITSFNIDESVLNDKLVYNSIPLWDSVGHMQLIANIEGTFDIMMETEDILDFSSYGKGIEILKKYNIIL